PRIVDSLRVDEDPHAPIPGEQHARQPARLLVPPHDPGLLESLRNRFGVLVGELAEIHGGHPLAGHDAFPSKRAASAFLFTLRVEPRGSSFTTTHRFGRRYAASSLRAHRSISPGVSFVPFF